MPRLSGATAISIGFLAVMRLLYEGFSPLLDWTGRIGIVLSLTALVALAAVALLKRIPHRWLPLPFVINLLWLFDPAVNLTRGRLIFAASLWLILLFWADGSDRNSQSTRFKSKRRWLFSSLLAAAVGTIYLLTMSHSVGFADTFEFQVSAPRMAVVHPTGYPLYLILGKLWTLLPVSTIAWRLNFGTAVYAIGGSVMTLWLVSELSEEGQEPAGVVAGFLLATLPIVWSQAIAAEVYTLHLLIASAALWLMNRLLTGRVSWQKGAMWLALLLGFGMTNHVTTVFLLPAAALVMWWRWAPFPRGEKVAPKGSDEGLSFARFYLLPTLKLAGWFLAPLTLYAYLPLRWQAINHEPMGGQRFFEWIVGGRFQDALQWRAPFADAQRLPIFSQLVLDQWPWWLFLLAAAGVMGLFIKRPKFAVALLLTIIGFSYYTMSYYVPDLAVFMLPIHLIIAISIGFALIVLTDFLASHWSLVTGNWSLLLLIPAIWLVTIQYPTLDLSADDGREAWARAVLSQDLDPLSTILADSEKHPLLFYVQQTADLRPDIDIMILPDEAAYRAELDRRVASGETVYLARFLPQLAGIYNLQAAGPLTKVTADPVLSSKKTPILAFGDVDLISQKLTKNSRFTRGMVDVELTWRVNGPPAEPLKVFMRWQGSDSIFPAGRLPVNDFLPFNGVPAGGTISDFYLVPLTIEQLQAGEAILEIALAPAFTPSAEIDWQVVGSIPLISGASLTHPIDKTDVRIRATTVRNQPRGLSGKGLKVVRIPDQMRPAPLPTALNNFMFPIETDPPNDGSLTAGVYQVYSGVNQLTFLGNPLQLRCGWLQRPTDRCFLGTITVSGVTVPDGAVNYADKIALLDSAVSGTVTPGGQIELETTWQALEKIDEDYTIFVQVLNQDDQLVGQIDVKPAQGTRPTNLWEPAETLTDRYTIPLKSDLSLGDSHRLIIGFYRLSDFQRLTVLDPTGAPIGDHFSLQLDTGGE